MCLKCDGYSDEQIDRWYELTILTHGWAIASVEPPADPDDPAAPIGGWAFTMGATENFSMPELIITGMEFREAGHYLNWSLDFLRGGGTLAGLENDAILWAPVHEDNLQTELFYQYWNHYDEWPAPGGVIQLFPSTRDTCPCCIRDDSVDLSQPQHYLRS